MHRQRAIIIGGGVGGLATACLLAKAGHDVTVFEKNKQLGGRTGLLEAKGFRFDTGPSWYLMPEIFEHFFALLGEDIRKHLELKKLRPHYRVFYKGTDEQMDITGNIAADAKAFERIEPGAGKRLEKYLTRSAFIYRVAADHFLYKNYDRLSDFLTPEVLRASVRMPLLKSMHHLARSSFSDPRLQKIMEYPSAFLGASPYNAPALYSLLNYADFGQGVLYPMGGMYRLVEALVRIGKKHGVAYCTQTPVERIIVEDSQARGITVEDQTIPADLVISNADIHHTETVLLQPTARDHSQIYWRSRTLAPSALLLYLGVDRRYASLAHHNLLLGEAWRKNFAEIFSKNPRFPNDPSLYVCAPSKTDPSVAPSGCENLAILVPLAAGLQYTGKELQDFITQILATLEAELALPGLRKHIIFQKHFCVDDFAKHFNSPAGTGLGLAHTLKQTAVFRPRNISSKVEGLYFVGANVHPGIGLPSVLISAELAYKRLIGDTSAAPLATL